MKQLLLMLAAAVLMVGSAGAQTAAPGQDRSSASPPATQSEKADAKAARKSEGKKVAKSSKSGDDQPTNASKSATKAERDAAKAHRKTEGAKAAKGPKEPN